MILKGKNVICKCPHCQAEVAPVGDLVVAPPLGLINRINSQDCGDCDKLFTVEQKTFDARWPQFEVLPIAGSV
jgi:hypothetical protein